MDRNSFFGGNPVGVIVRLVVLSIIVGIVLSALNIRPDELLYHAQRLLQRLYDLGLPALDVALGYFLLGAVVVIPIWLVARLLGLFRRGDNGRP